MVKIFSLDTCSSAKITSAEGIDNAQRVPGSNKLRDRFLMRLKGRGDELRSVIPLLFCNGTLQKNAEIETVKADPANVARCR